MSYALELSNVSYSTEEEKYFDHIKLKLDKGLINVIKFKDKPSIGVFYNLLTTSLKPDTGTIKIYGHKLNKEKEYIFKFVGLKGTNISYFPSLTTNEFFKLSASFYDGLYIKKAKEYLKELGISSRKSIKSLSDEDKELVYFIDAIYTSPDLLIIINPYKKLNEKGRSFVDDKIKELKGLGKTILILTSESIYHGDRIYIHKNEKIEAIKSLSKLIDSAIDKVGGKKNEKLNTL